MSNAPLRGMCATLRRAAPCAKRESNFARRQLACYITAHQMSQTEQQFDYDAVTAPQPGPFGRFYLQELINSGGMADLWLATDSSNNHFALRKLRKTGAFDFTTRKRFIRGCDILSKIHNHEFVITYH